MKVAVLVGNPTAQKPSYATVCLAYEAYRRGHEVGLVGVDSLLMTDNGHLLGQVGTIPSPHQIPPPPTPIDADNPARREFLHAITAVDRVWWDLGECDVALLRLLARPRGLDEDDGRYDTFYRARIEAALAFAQRLNTETPALVLNDPIGVWQTSGKFFLSRIPAEFRPKTIITRDETAIREFIATLDGPAVIKPMLGHGGEDVFRVTPDDPNLSAILVNLLRQGFLVVQQWLSAAEHGERRLLLLDGRPILAPDGTPAMYRRKAKSREWRSNLHIGGQPEPAEFTPTDATLTAHIGPLLRQHGLYFVGLDLIGDKLLEINAFCPGGIHVVQKMTGFDSAVAIIDDLETRAGGRLCPPSP